MTRTLYIHVGMPKTATTTVQTLFARHGALDDLGIAYPMAGRLPKAIAHHPVAQAVAAGDTTAYAPDPTRDTLISSEAFINCIAGEPATFSHFRDFLAMLGADRNLKLIAFLRDAVSFFESMYLQDVKTGLVRSTFAEYVAVRGDWYEILFQNLRALQDDAPQSVYAFLPHRYAADWQEALTAPQPFDTSQRANPRLSLKANLLFLRYDEFARDYGIDMNRHQAIYQFSHAPSPFDDDTTDFTVWPAEIAHRVASDALAAADKHGFDCYVDAFARRPVPAHPVVDIPGLSLPARDMEIARDFLTGRPQQQAGTAPRPPQPPKPPAQIKSSHPNGHFYSPVVNPEEVIPYADRLWPSEPPTVLGIDFNDDHHRHVLENLYPRYYPDYDYPEHGAPDTELKGYYTRNGQFSWLDGRTLFVLMRAWQPKRLVEVGSGYSTLLASDVNQRFLGGTCQIDAIEPYPRPFLHNPAFGVRLIEKKVQDVPLEEFETIEPEGILFIDSSHVCKIGSDVHYLYFEVLPRLQAGVRIHIHDIFLPREYPKRWMLEDNRGWNEQYLVRALLMDSTAYRVLFGCAYAHAMLPDLLGKALGRPTSFGGGSLWLEKV